jgi:ribonuclease III
VTDSAAPRDLLEQRLGLPIEPSLLECALTHRSFSFENGECPNNERLEFLGDSVLGLVVTTHLFRTHPDLPEGQLAKFRSHVVNSRALAQVARGLELGQFLRLGKGEENTNGRDKSSILADTVEALIGAVYLDHDLETAGELIHRLFGPLMSVAAELGAGLDWKTSLQELTAEHSLGVPTYLVDEEGPEHDKSFTARVRVGEQDYPSGQGRSKKVAEQIAAEHAYRSIRKEHGSNKAEPDVTSDKKAKPDKPESEAPGA